MQKALPAPKGPCTEHQLARAATYRVRPTVGASVWVALAESSSVSDAAVTRPSLRRRRPEGSAYMYLAREMLRPQPRLDGFYTHLRRREPVRVDRKALGMLALR